MFRVDGEGTLRITRRTEAHFHLLRRILIKGTEYFSTSPTIELDVFQLRKDCTPSSHYSTDSNESVEMNLSEISEGVGSRELGNSDVDFGVDSSVGGVVEEDDGEGDGVEER